MEVLNTPDDARLFTQALRQSHREVGLVPTMGALHEGHLSLVRQSAQRCGATVATIFVNPTQFGPCEDLDKYPRTLDDDLRSLQEEGVAGVFVPDKATMYPEGFSTYVHPPEVARTLEGACRPDHFRGVVTIVLKLFQAIPASHAFFGKKDYQQWRVIEAMTRDLDVGIEIVGCDTVREPDGLALSSRNRYLSDQQRRQALLLAAALSAAAQQVSEGELQVDAIEAAMRQVLVGSSGPTQTDGEPRASVDKIDYAVIADATSLVPLVRLDRPAVALIAAHVGTTRLIDNRELTPQVEA